MKWRGRQRSTNVEDRRGAGGGLGGGFNPFGRTAGTGGPRIQIPTGGGGIGGIGLVIVIALIGMAVFGINPLALLGGNVVPGGGAGTGSSTQGQPLPEAGQDELADFVAVVMKETENLWTEVFAQSGDTYAPPVLILFSGQTEGGCGVADARTGPFYCPVDQRVYIDLSFYEQLRRQFGAPGDFAQAYVLAHEVGHHVQNLTGVLPEFNRARAAMSETEANAYSVRVELQADCYAGVWANFVGQANLLESGDIEEAINAANQIGDDTLQERMQGFAVPKTFNHGTSAQRKAWFQRGYSTADVGQCDTFSVAQP